MRLAEELYNPIASMMESFETSSTHLSIPMLASFKLSLLSCGYMIDTDAEAFAIMGILEEMGLISIQYSCGKPEKIKKLCYT